MGCRLLIVADDFTGALDTAAALAREGIATGVVTLDGLPGGRLSQADIQRETVLVVDTESRHLPAEKAYEIYHTLCSSAQEIPHVYIKTDSVLRGNLSASALRVRKRTIRACAHFPSARCLPRNNSRFSQHAQHSVTLFTLSYANPAQTGGFFFCPVNKSEIS